MSPFRSKEARSAEATLAPEPARRMRVETVAAGLPGGGSPAREPEMPASTRPVLLCALLAAAPLAASVEPEPAAAEPEAMEEVVLDMADPQDCLALAMYWESKGEGEEGMQAVGMVVLNRAASPDFPEDICAVVTEGSETPPCQFSFWCDGLSDQPEEPEPWALARDLALRLTTEPPPDPTDGALYFHGAVLEPDWAGEREATVQIGEHVYYR